MTPSQTAAAERLGQDVCVDAGPGSGKTTVLVARFAWLVRTQRVPPARILAITFTEKAATEMKKRLVKEFEAEPELRRQIERAWVSTIHSFCARLVRENGIAAGVDVGFSVLEQTQSDPLLEEAVEEALDALFAERPEGFRELLGSLAVSTRGGSFQPDLAGALISVYQAVRVAGTGFEVLQREPEGNPVATFRQILRDLEGLIEVRGAWNTPNRRAKRDELAEWLSEARRAQTLREMFDALGDLPVNLQGLADPVKTELKRIREEAVPQARSVLVSHLFHPLRSLLVEALGRLDAAYRGKKRARAALDFSDLEESALRLLAKRPEVAARVRAQFDYILMDELQDTNPLQWRILEQIRRPGRFFGVGDINQSIYAFRHAEPELFRRYRDGLRASGHEINTLLENFRSRPDILEAAETILEGAEGLEPRRLTASAQFAPKDRPSVEVIVAAAETSAPAREIETYAIARRIREIESEWSRPFSDIVVLARKADTLAPIEDALRDFDIPCIVVGGRTLLECPEVIDVIHLLRVVANTRDELALAGLLRSPFVGASDETLLRLKLTGGLWRRLTGEGLDEIPEPERERLAWLRELVAEFRQNRDVLSPDRMAVRALDESGYFAALPATARRNVERFLGLVRGLWRRDRGPLAEILEEIAALREAAVLAEAPPAEAANAVRLMTIHGAKGLEFPIVFLAGLDQRARNELDPIAFSPSHGFGVKWRDPASGEAVSDPAYVSAEDELKRKLRAEEMRLFYVAMTRAKEHLVLSCAVGDKAHGSEWSRLVLQRVQVEKAPEAADEVRRLGEAGPPVRLLVVREAPENTFPPPALAQEEAPQQLTAPPEVTGQHDSAAAPTEIGEFVYCPRKYWLGTLRPLPVGGSGIGTEVHRLLAGEAVEDAEAHALARVFEESELGRRAQNASRAEREFDFAFELEGIILRGQIDLWFEEGGETILVDYKTDRESDARRKESYFLQLRLYAMALERLTGRLPDRALLFYLRRDEVVSVSLDDASMEAARRMVGAFREAQEKREFPLREGAHCFRCPYFRGPCPAQGSERAEASPSGEISTIRESL
jgi:ATP-dependent exoDNAse (exonuclease V) beta subunit